MKENTGATPQLNIAPPGTSAPESEPRLSSEASVRKRGAQPGNRNARKHGLYARYLSPKQLQDYNEACGVRGVEAELALFRCKLAEMLETEPWNVILLNRITNTILRLEAALPAEPEELEPTARSLNIMSPFFAHALAAGDKDVTRAFNDWMEKHHSKSFGLGNESHVQTEANSG